MKFYKQMKKYLQLIKNGLIDENPVFVLILGMCPALGTTTSAINGLAMGLATTFILLCSNVVISSLKNLIPDQVRIPAYIVVIAALSCLSAQRGRYCEEQSDEAIQ